MFKAFKDELLNRLCAWLSYYVPRRLRYFVIIDSVAKYTSVHETEAVPEVTAMDVAKHFER